MLKYGIKHCLSVGIEGEGMPKRRRPRVCSVCGTTENVNRRSYLCFPCAMEKMQDSIQQLQQKEGPIYEKWRDGLMRHLGLVDESD